MFRLTLLPIFLLIAGFLFTLVTFYIVRKIKRTTKQVIKKSSEFTKEFAAEQQQKWSQREQRKQLPEILQKAYVQFDDIQENTRKLPEQWKTPLSPVVDQANVILLAVSTKPELTSHIRSFFNHTLDSLSQLINKLKTDHKHLNDSQTEKARQNIMMFKADLMQHQQTLNKQKEFDFDVLMDVIKARLKQ